MENGVRPPLGFVTRIRDRRFVAKIQKEEIHDIEEKRMIERIVALAAIAVLMGSSVVAAGAKDGLSDNATLAQDRNQEREWLDKAGQSGQPFFCWYNTTACHIWSHSPRAYIQRAVDEGRAEEDVYRAKMIEHDELVGSLLKKLDAIVGTSVRPEVAVVFDWEVRWALATSEGILHTSFRQTHSPANMVASGCMAGSISGSQAKGSPSSTIRSAR